MRCTEPIQVKLFMPVPVNELDGNGVIYSEEIVENAVKKFKSPVPLMMKEKVIGVIDKIDFSKKDKNLIADGVIFFGGTNCLATIDSANKKVIKEMNIVSFGIDISTEKNR